MPAEERCESRAGGRRCRLRWAHDGAHQYASSSPADPTREEAPSASPGEAGEDEDWSDGLSGEEYALLCTMHDASCDWGKSVVHRPDDGDLESSYQRSRLAGKALADYIASLRREQDAVMTRLDDVMQLTIARTDLGPEWATWGLSGRIEFILGYILPRLAAESRLSSQSEEIARLREDVAEWEEQHRRSTTVNASLMEMMGAANLRADAAESRLARLREAGDLFDRLDQHGVESIYFLNGNQINCGIMRLRDAVADFFAVERIASGGLRIDPPTTDDPGF